MGGRGVLPSLVPGGGPCTPTHKVQQQVLENSTKPEKVCVKTLSASRRLRKVCIKTPGIPNPGESLCKKLNGPQIQRPGVFMTDISRLAAVNAWFSVPALSLT